MFATPQDFFKTASATFAALPKTPEDFQAVLTKAKNVYDVEAKNGKAVFDTYAKAAKGEATVNEIVTANQKAKDLMVASRFACLMSLPGSIFALPALTKLEDTMSITLVPKSVKKEFNL
jgi:hypothetical protein